jgi:1,4-dihydroxy-2-naphthoyl-CoA hydrolase
MAIWHKSVNLDDINETVHKDTLMEQLGIQITELTDNAMIGTMPVDHRTRQPFGVLHGGASVALAETLGSMACWLTLEEPLICFGMDIQANHIRPMTSGLVTGIATQLHRGTTTQIWDIRLEDEQHRTVCVARLTLAIRTPRNN